MFHREDPVQERLARLQRLPGGFIDRLASLQMEKHAVLVRHHHVRQGIAIGIARLDLHADAGVVIDQVGDELDCSVGRPHGAEPVDHRRIALARIVAVVGPEALSGDDVLESIAVDVFQRHGMELTEGNAIRILQRIRRDDGMAEKLAVLLLEPSQAKLVGRQAGEDVLIAVAIEVVGMHLRPAGTGEIGPMRGPLRIVGQRRGLFPPATLFQEIDPTIAVHIADPQAMGEFGPRGVVGREPMPGPRFLGCVLLRLGVAEHSVDGAVDLRLSVPGQIAIPGGLVVDLGQRERHLPIARLGAGIAIPSGFLAGESDHEEIEPAIGIEVPDVGEEVVGVAVDVERLGRIDLDLPFKRWAQPEEGTGHDVAMAVAAQIRQGSTLGVELIGELFALPRDPGALCGLGADGENQDQRDPRQEGALHWESLAQRAPAPPRIFWTKFGRFRT